MWPLKNRRATHSKCTYNMKNPSKFHYLNHRLSIHICQQSNLRKDTLLDKISVQNNRHAFVGFFVTDLSVLPKYQITKIWCCSAYFSHVFIRTIVDYHPLWVLGAN